MTASVSIAQTLPLFSGATTLSRTLYRGWRADADRVQDVVEGVKLAEPAAIAEAATWMARSRRLHGPALVVPVPRSSSTRPSLLGLAAALVERGVGDEAREIIERRVEVSSSRLRRREGLPGVSSAQHRASFTVRRPGPGEAMRPLLLVDDVVTRGNVLTAAVQSVREAGWRGPIRAAVVARAEDDPGPVRGRQAIGPRVRVLFIPKG